MKHEVRRPGPSALHRLAARVLLVAALLGVSAQILAAEETPDTKEKSPFKGRIILSIGKSIYAINPEGAPKKWKADASWDGSMLKEECIVEHGWNPVVSWDGNKILDETDSG